MKEKVSKNHDLEELLLNSKPEDRKELKKLGLMPESVGLRKEKRLEKTFIQIQNEKLELLMKRVDVPLEEEMREWAEYRGNRAERVPLPGAITKDDYQVYRSVKKRDVTKRLLDEKEEKEEEQREAEEEERINKKRKEDEITAKKRAKRLKKKEKLKK
jgi:Protein of unknown function (DUF1168)